jgi:hypothetical protein
MSSYTALFDANVLYPAPLRDLLLQLAITDTISFRQACMGGLHGSTGIGRELSRIQSVRKKAMSCSCSAAVNFKPNS